MKKGLINLLLIAGINLGAYGMGNPEFHVETDAHKFIPKGAHYIEQEYTIDDKYEITTFWYCPNDKTFEDYKNDIQLDSETFVDINGDGIPDMTLPDAEQAYRKMQERIAREKSSIM